MKFQEIILALQQFWSEQGCILELVDLGAKAIFVNPVDVDNIAPALIKAREKNVKIIAIDTNFPDNNLADCTIVSDNYLAGMQCGQHLLAHRSSAHIALLTHQQAMSAQERIDGFRNAIKDKPEFQLFYLVLSGMAAAMAIRVSHFMGQKDYVAVRRNAYDGFRLNLLFSLCMGLPVLLRDV